MVMGRLVLVMGMFELWSIPNLGIEVWSIPPLGRFGVVIGMLEVWYIPPLERFGVVMGRFDVWSIPTLWIEVWSILTFVETPAGHREALIGNGEVRVVVHSKFGDRGVVHSTFGEVHFGHW